MARRPNYRLERADRARKQTERAAKKAAAREAKSKARGEIKEEPDAAGANAVRADE